MKKSLNVTVVGGGNSTPIFAALAKIDGHNVSILTRRPKDWAKEIGFMNEDAGYLDGLKEMRTGVDLITNDPSKCIPQADLIFLAGVPIHHNEQILKDLIAPYISRNKLVHVGSICA
jgi:glycerol-3-phosphate dehydrogenase